MPAKTELTNLNPSTSHFPGLDSLRGIGAVTIIVYHIELTKSFNRLPNLMSIPFFEHESGRNMIIMFFVLSGFLITYKLLTEQYSTGSNSKSRFYLKRILRIWPLYYFILALSAWALNYTPKPSTFWMCILIFPNLAHATIGGWVASPQTWSIGAEEQFYLAWPWVIDKFKQHIHKVLWLLFFGLTLLPFVLMELVEEFYYEPGRINTIRTVFKFTKFNCMALGGLLAYWVIHEPKFAQVLKTKILSAVIVIAPFILTYAGITFSYINDEVYAILFGLLIVHAAMNQGGGFFLNNRVFNYLGLISYGIYMYHRLMIILGLRFVPPVFYDSVIASNAVYYLIVLTFTIGAATLSYYLFERRFLNLKNRLS